MKEKKTRFISLNIKVFCISLVVVMIPILIIGSLLYDRTIKIIEQKQETAVLNSFRNIADNLQGMMDNAQNISLFLIQDEAIRNALSLEEKSKSDLLEYQNDIISSLCFFVGQNTYIQNIYIEGENDFEVAIGEKCVDISDDILSKVHIRNGGAVWAWTENQENGEIFLSLTREINNIEYIPETLGIININLSEKVLQEQFENHIQAYPGYIAIVNEKGEEMFSSGGMFLQKKHKNWEEILKNEDGLIQISQNANEVYYFYKIPNQPWGLISCINTQDLFGEIDTIRTLLISGIVITLILCLIIIYAFSEIILKPLRILTKRMQDITEENYNIRIDIQSNDEIGVLSNSFNKMVKRLDELVNEVLKGEILKRDAQIEALQAQINPHFLYNNLDMAYWMSRLEHADKTGKILLALSDLYRLTVRTSGKLVSVETEAHYMEDYIVIQQMRLNDMVHFVVEVEESVLHHATEKFVIQPLIENSIEHGILPKGEHGEIRIRIYKCESNLYFEVEDTGIGASIEEMTNLLRKQQNEGKRGLAIRNIDQRIKLQFGSEYGLHFEKQEQGGIRAIVVQPIMIFEEKVK